MIYLNWSLPHWKEQSTLTKEPDLLLQNGILDNYMIACFSNQQPSDVSLTLNDDSRLSQHFLAGWNTKNTNIDKLPFRPMSLFVAQDVGEETTTEVNKLWLEE